MSDYPEELLYFIKCHDDPIAPDGAWWAMMEDAVSLYNKDNGTHFDENDAVHFFLKWDAIQGNGGSMWVI